MSQVGVEVGVFAGVAEADLVGGEGVLRRVAARIEGFVGSLSRGWGRGIHEEDEAARADLGRRILQE